MKTLLITATVLLWNTNLEIRPSRTLDRALHDAARLGTVEDVRRLLREGADVNTRNPAGISGSTPLHEAAGRGDLEMVKLLIENRAKVDIADDLGFTALFRAGTAEVVEALLASGANPSLRNRDGETVLEWAKRNGFGWKVEALGAARPGAGEG